MPFIPSHITRPCSIEDHANQLENIDTKIELLETNQNDAKATVNNHTDQISELKLDTDELKKNQNENLANIERHSNQIDDLETHVDGFNVKQNETQVIATVLAHDMENDPDIVAILGASAALTISGLPFMGPIGGCRVGWDGKNYILNPTIDQMKVSSLDLVVAGTTDGVLMVESEASELSEEIMLGAVDYGHNEIEQVIKAIIDLAEVAAKEPRPLPDEPKEKEEYLKTIKPFRKKFENII